MLIEIFCPDARLQLAAALAPANVLVRPDEVLTGFITLLDWVLGLGFFVGLAAALASFTVRHWIACGLDALVALCKRGTYAD